MKITVQVRPNSSQQKVEQIDESSYKVHLKKQAVEGKANAELISVLKKHFKAPVKIIKGHRGKTKIIEVEKCQ